MGSLHGWLLVLAFAAGGAAPANAGERELRPTSVIASRLDSSRIGSKPGAPLRWKFTDEPSAPKVWPPISGWDAQVSLPSVAAKISDGWTVVSGMKRAATDETFSASLVSQSLLLRQPAIRRPSNEEDGTPDSITETPPGSPIRPDILRVPSERPLPEGEEESIEFVLEPLLEWESQTPLGFSGPSGVMPTEIQDSAHFAPVEDRWRVGFPYWDRNDEPDTWLDDSPYVLGRWWDPYNQNVLKGDYPLVGQHTFFNLTAATQLLQEFRQARLRSHWRASPTWCDRPAHGSPP